MTAELRFELRLADTLYTLRANLTQAADRNAPLDTRTEAAKDADGTLMAISKAMQQLHDVCRKTADDIAQNLPDDAEPTREVLEQDEMRILMYDLAEDFSRLTFEALNRATTRGTVTED